MAAHRNTLNKSVDFIIDMIDIVKLCLVSMVADLPRLIRLTSLILIEMSLLVCSYFLFSFGIAIPTMSVFLSDDLFLLKSVSL